MKKKMTKAAMTFPVCFLPAFMLLIFGPAEIFFANATEFQFVYGEFAGRLALIAFVISVLATAALVFVPDVAYRVAMSVLFGFSLAGYLQVMSLNGRLDLLGVTAEAADAPLGKNVGNLIIWILVIAAILSFAFIRKEIWKKAIVALSAFLLAIQTAALISLLLTAKKEAFERPQINWHLSGEKQYMVSADKNVILIVLDCFSNQYIEDLERQYPGATDFLHDFTYYNNAECVYLGTFPSLPHMLSGCPVDMEKKTNEWCADIWTNEHTTNFYHALRKKGYAVNLYTPDANIICGTNDKKILSGIFSNAVNAAQEVDVDRKLLYKTVCKMSAYRMLPGFLKPQFYTGYSEYMNIVTARENKIAHDNHEFYEGLLEKGLKTERGKNYFIVQHLMGTHLYNTDANGFYVEDGTLVETAKGCMTIVEEYLEQLKAAGAYDDATIILTSDHGVGYEAQVIFYIKRPGEAHERSPVTRAPISHAELLPTIAKAVFGDGQQYGETIDDFFDGELRERIYWIRSFDERYDAVPCYTGEKMGSANVYNGYIYMGDSEALRKKIKEGPDLFVLMADSYF